MGTSSESRTPKLGRPFPPTTEALQIELYIRTNLWPFFCIRRQNMFVSFHSTTPLAFFYPSRRDEISLEVALEVVGYYHMHQDCRSKNLNRESSRDLHGDS